MNIFIANSFSNKDIHALVVIANIRLVVWYVLFFPFLHLMGSIYHLLHCKRMGKRAAKLDLAFLSRPVVVEPVTRHVKQMVALGTTGDRCLRLFGFDVLLDESWIADVAAPIACQNLLFTAFCWGSVIFIT